MTIVVIQNIQLIDNYQSALCQKLESRPGPQ